MHSHVCIDMHGHAWLWGFQVPGGLEAGKRTMVAGAGRPGERTGGWTGRDAATRRVRNGKANPATGMWRRWHPRFGQSSAIVGAIMKLPNIYVREKHWLARTRFSFFHRPANLHVAGRGFFSCIRGNQRRVRSEYGTQRTAL